MNRESGKVELVTGGKGMNVAEIPLEQFVDVAASVAHGIAHVNCRVHFELGEPTIHHTEPLSVVGMLVGDKDAPQPPQIEIRLVAAGEKVALADAAVDENALTRHHVLDDGGVTL